MTAMSKNNVMMRKILPTHSAVLDLDVAEQDVILAFWVAHRVRKNAQPVLLLLEKQVLLL
jgi:hypothetical protein